jgi:hypothetical protein
MQQKAASFAYTAATGSMDSSKRSFTKTGPQQETHQDRAATITFTQKQHCSKSGLRPQVSGDSTLGIDMKEYFFGKVRGGSFK